MLGNEQKQDLKILTCSVEVGVSLKYNKNRLAARGVVFALVSCMALDPTPFEMEQKNLDEIVNGLVFKPHSVVSVKNLSPVWDCIV